MIPLCVPEIGGNEWKYVRECLESGWVASTGPFITRFEREIERYTGAAHAVATSSGTAALHAALRIIGLQPGEEVIVPDLAFVACANAVRYCHAYPVFLDVDPDTWHLDVAQLERFFASEVEVRRTGCFNKRTGRRVRAILPVHILGNACEIDRIVEIAQAYGVGVVEDAAESLGVRYRGRHAGTFGDVGIISFNANKVVTAGGGGVILCNNAAVARHALYLATTAKDDAVEFVHGAIGFNYRMSNVHAAIGVAQMEKVEEFLKKKRAIARRYEELLNAVPGITPMPVTRYTEGTYWQYVALLDPSTTLSRRRAVVRGLFENGVASRAFWHPTHALKPYIDCQAYEIHHANRLYERGIGLPCSVGLSMADQDQVIDVLHRVLRSISD